jgi:hypothetical protein
MRKATTTEADIIDLLDQAIATIKLGVNLLLDHPEEAPQVIEKTRQMIGAVTLTVIGAARMEIITDWNTILNKMEKMGLLLGSDLDDEGLYFRGINEWRSYYLEENQ